VKTGTFELSGKGATCIDFIKAAFTLSNLGSISFSIGQQLNAYCAFGKMLFFS